MKNVKGGMPDCASGQSLYYCGSGGSCTTVYGYVCATSVGGANQNQINTWKTEGVWGDCYNTVICSDPT